MLAVTLSHAVAAGDLALLKEAAALRLASVRSPAQRVEILARALGFQTWAALQAHAALDSWDRQPVQLAPALDYAAARSLKVTALDIHLTLALMSFKSTVQASSMIHAKGWGHQGCESALAGAEAETEGLSYEERQLRNGIRLKSRQKELRQELLAADRADTFLRAQAFFAGLEFDGDAGREAPSIYALQHLAGTRPFDLEGGVHLDPQEIPLPDMIAAAWDLGAPLLQDPSRRCLRIGVQRGSLGGLPAGDMVPDPRLGGWMFSVHSQYPMLPA